MRLSVVQNPLNYPARPPLLNTSHPAYQNIRMAPVALPGAAMRDLVTNITYNNVSTGGQSRTDVTPIGHGVYPGANANLSYIGITPLVAGETFNEDTIAVIFQARAPMTVGQGMVGENIANGGSFKLQTGNTGNINLVSVGSNLWAVPAVDGHCYFAAASLLKARNSSNSVVRNLTTGQLWTFTNAAAGGAPVAGTAYNVVTYNTVSGVNPGRIACASLSAKYTRPADLLRWARDPWSLWYAPPALVGARKVAASVVTPTTGSGAALMIGA
jgi:hypothetical protein